MLYSERFLRENFLTNFQFCFLKRASGRDNQQKKQQTGSALSHCLEGDAPGLDDGCDGLPQVVYTVIADVAGNDYHNRIDYSDRL